MTLAETIAANDLLRKELKGGILLMTPSVWDLEPRLRARAIYRLSLYKTFEDEDDDHSSGVFVFAGYVFFFEIREFAGERSITLMMKEDVV